MIQWRVMLAISRAKHIGCYEDSPTLPVGNVMYLAIVLDSYVNYSKLLPET